MSKLQKLLNEHKDQLRDYCSEIKYEDWYIFCHDSSWCVSWSMTLNDLLFQTPFLSWLEWNSWHSNKRIMSINWQLFEADSDISDYHKINLCLLTTDEERIQYLEDNIIDE